VQRRFAALLVVTFLLGHSGYAHAQTAPCSSPEDVIFVCDGAGNYQITSKQFRTVVASTHAPLTVETFAWSHGNKKILPDLTDVQHACQQGKLLAETVLDYRVQHPDAKIHLVGHSAGSMVVLTAAENLPPDTLDTIVLLLPAVSSAYDIRPSLRSVRGTMEVHYSGHDWFYLGLCTFFAGCADHQSGAASGRVGFQLIVESPEDAALLPRLVQHPWQPSYGLLGNHGGHYGAYQPEYVKSQILPVLLHTCH
jgi:pimeloyl-ACP methyl ester carboxylesterase